MRLILLGPPGAGKGTHADIFSKKYDIPHISTGNILREAVGKKAPIGEKASSYILKGELVPDNLVVEIVKERLVRGDVKDGFILDGFPRTKQQARYLDRILKRMKMPVDLVLYLDTSEDVVIQRLSGRLTCGSCSAIFHIKNIPPKKAGTCDFCGSHLAQRIDDQEATVRNRLKVYKKQVAGIIKYYERNKVLLRVCGDLEISELFTVLSKILKQKALVP